MSFKGTLPFEIEFCLKWQWYIGQVCFVKVKSCLEEQLARGLWKRLESTDADKHLHSWNANLMFYWGENYTSNDVNM